MHNQIFSYIVILLMSTFMLSCNSSSKTDKQNNQPEVMDENAPAHEKIKSYLVLLEEIGTKNRVMPIEEIRLGNQFAELKDTELLKKSLLTDKNLNHKNFHVKRVVAIAFRNLGTFDDVEINKAMMNLLGDSADWVVYDAIWYFKAAKTSDKLVIDKIKDISIKTELTKEQLAEESPSSDPKVNMKWMADETLELLK